MISDVLARISLQIAFEPGNPVVAHAVQQQGAVETWQRVQAEGSLGKCRARMREIDVDALLQLADKAHARYVTPADPQWPLALADLAQVRIDGMAGAPLGLWVRGKPLPISSASLAVVGARAATTYGEDVAAQLSADLADMGTTIVSGAAYGIDAAAHRGALAVGGATVAVVACGVDVAYPAQHAGLLNAIVASGSIVSEHPPGSHPTRYRFLARNRIIAALSAGTLIVEAAARSGAKNTVNWAQRLGRDTFAVPGSIFSSSTLTPHRLIRDQEAVLVTSAEEILSVTRSGQQPALCDAEGEQRIYDHLSDAQRLVLDTIPAGIDVSAGDVAGVCGITWPQAVELLLSLESFRLVAETSDGTYRLGARRANNVVASAQPIRLITQPDAAPE